MTIPTSRQVLQRWVNGVNSGNLEDVLSLYASAATLLPTFAAQTANTEEWRRDYFAKLAAREHLSVELREKTVRVFPAGDGIDVLSGIYCFHFALGGEVLNFEARFTFVIDPSREQPILHHHSSQIPRQL